MNKPGVKDPTCNYLENPIGTALEPPFFNWKMTSDQPGASQSAYQLQVASSTAFGTPLWDSGWVESNSSVRILYQGPALQSSTRYFWHVRIRDGSKQTSDWSETCFWETGLKISDWQAKWIEPEGEVDPKAFKPAPYLRRCFELGDGIQEARLYITTHGIYEAYLNGKRISEVIFMPGHTAYNVRLQVQAYDVLDLLGTGMNCMGVILGDGWYRGEINVSSTRNSHGTKVALLSQLKITYADGHTQWICSDQDWMTSTGPILRSDLKEGEVYDARREMPGWNMAGFDEKDWQPVHVADHKLHNLIPTEGLQIRKMEELSPVKIITTPQGETVIDFGQNIAGFVRMRVSGVRGMTVRLQHSEVLDQDGNFTLSYLKIIGNSLMEQADEYTLRGDGLETYEPHFSVHGFRYVKVEGYPGPLDPANFTAFAVYSDMKKTGSFECSNPKINQLHKNITWSMKGNFLDIPTDCPTRERAGWTGDAQIFVHTGSILMNGAAFYSKWIQDVSAQQYPNGCIRNVVPEKTRKSEGLMERIGNMPPGSSGWGDAVVIIPWTLYQMFGDTTILEKEYASMKKWVEFERKRAEHIHWLKLINPAFWLDKERRARQKYIWDTRYQWGEWLEPDILIKDVAKVILHNVVLSDPIVASAYFEHSCRLLGQIAGVLGRAEDQAEYSALADKIKEAYIKEFIRPDGSVTAYAKKQAPYVRALAFGLFTDELRPLLEKQLVARVEEKGRHLYTGFLSTPFLLQILSETGHRDLAYAILLQEDHPSWLYAINKGATTIWEDWEGVSEAGVPTASQNHYSKGAVASWFYECICGIQLDPAIPAYKHFFLRPQPGGGLQYARAFYNSIQGEIRSEWESLGSKIKYRFTVPPNTSATVTLEGDMEIPQTKVVRNVHRSDNRVSFDLLSGSYEFIVNPIPAG
jgi:alpha-L-rhamnosidase